MSEHSEQVALFQWAERSGRDELRLMHAIPNGGLRHVRVASKLRREGVKKGVPDIHLPVAKGGFHGLYIELKKPKDHKSPAGRATQEQIEWVENLNEQGYLAVICIGWDAARKTIESYLDCRAPNDSYLLQQQGA